jgi:putative phosphoesterase
MSDSHGNSKGMVNVVEHEKPDIILHLGDKMSDCFAIERSHPNIPMRKVLGNCDFSTQGLTVDEFTLGGKRFFMTHGHVYNVKAGLRHLIETAKSRQPDIVLFGHTHIQHREITSEFVLINPGTMFVLQEYYAVIHMSDDDITCDLRRMET